ncbi:hypothetical protein [Clostridium thailandense]|uniref:hypothetical protein n=1 Tax=Clostridium thailandense TaxID=2794346 RepID=UPI003989E9EF
MKKIEVIYPLHTDEEMIYEMKHYCFFKKNILDLYKNSSVIYNPYYYYEFTSKVKVNNKIRDYNYVLLIDGLSGEPIIIDKNIQLMGFEQKELRGQVQIPTLQETEAEEIASDNLTKAVYGKYSKFPEYQIQHNKIIYRKYYNINYKGKRAFRVPGDCYKVI